MSFAVMPSGGFTGASTAYASMCPFGGMGSASSGINTPSSVIQGIAGVAGVLSELAVFLTSTAGVTRTITVYVGGSVGNQTIVLPDSTSGWFTDTTHTDSVSAGSAVELACKRASGSFTILATRLKFTPSSGKASFQMGGDWSGSSLAAATYLPIGGSIYANTALTETVAQCLMRTAGTSKYLSMGASINNSTTSITVRVRKNGANGNQLVTVPSTTTGRYTDTTNTDTYVDGTLLALSVSAPATSYLAWRSSCLSFVQDTDKYDFITADANNAAIRAASATASYIDFFSRINTFGTTEANKIFRFGYDVTVDRPRIYISANSYAASVTFKSRKNAADGNLSVTVANGTTGRFEDTTNSDTIGPTDEFCYTVAGGTSGNLTIFSIITRVDTAVMAVARSQAMVIG